MIEKYEDKDVKIIYNMNNYFHSIVSSIFKISLAMPNNLQQKNFKYYYEENTSEIIDLSEDESSEMRLNNCDHPKFTIKMKNKLKYINTITKEYKNTMEIINALP